ncbi:hypothetical protein SS50377_24585 [Spironucleus salmonicida]|uniref:Uncharacterized protein n=1 Tax=Spironucleus salmonicida TaxID=348837 RepID=V6LJ06_9EUKA|nr:hypothetical protein SS50377_24585 [Spironucleus salmonicida]|eukprot:EST44557.1 Hypothetical protein SS50377_15559 [Spironucleus salmonicida]
MDAFFCEFLKQEHENKEIFVNCNGDSYTGLAKLISNGKIILISNGEEIILETKNIDSIRNIRKLLSRPVTSGRTGQNQDSDNHVKSEQTRRRPSVKSILRK